MKFCFDNSISVYGCYDGCYDDRFMVSVDLKDRSPETYVSDTDISPLVLPLEFTADPRLVSDHTTYTLDWSVTP